MVVKSILRYVGGKSRAVKHILPHLEGAEVLYSPFFGGGSIEFAFSEKGKVIACDLYEPVAVFWQEAIKNPKVVAHMVKKYHPLSKERFYSLQKELPQLDNPLDIASVFYVLNRASFSGSTNSGGMSPNHPRFNQASIDRLRKFSAPNVEIQHKDAFDFLEELTKIEPTGKAIYLDPPYMIKNNLYGNKGDMHKHFNHEKLAEIVNRLHSLGWKIVLSYNRTEEIEKWYSNFEIIPVDWKYGMNATKESDEYLIVNLTENSSKVNKGKDD